ncbi:tetratricopeptide repeat-containing protein [Elizabethkingia anophelis]|nr:tetratricopeptide repeat-containing protein [Elizabethkingia anophelis]MCT3633685.1 tetratricopeptide repeat-containing protein [Elizabethkingia anophelis]MCT3830382.1 tetratricopeptide repeat-containing protein [Elizabethkingia anophelis]MCT3883889.1 tetratricopeptide repeat-containing protein [Elizabethkingia anophelis]MCT3894657.1 tetratricopeptide repeat-containing protein [Elizabethkingia anophelis]
MKEKLYEELTNKAWDFYDNQDYKKVEKSCNDIIKKFPDKFGGYYLLGIVKQAEKQYKKAIECFKIVLEKDIDKKVTGLVYYWIGEIYGTERNWDFTSDDKNEMYDYEKSIYNYEKSFEYEDYPRETVDKLIYIFREDYYKRCHILKKSLEKFNDDAEFKVEYSKSLILINQRTEAYNFLKKECEVFNYSILYYQLSKLYYEDSDLDNSLNNCEIALKDYRENSHYALIGLNYSLGKIYYRKKDWLSAYNFFKKSFDIIIDKNLNSEFRNYNLWVCAFGIIASLGQLRRNSEIINFINSLPLIPENLDYFEFEFVFLLNNTYTDTEVELYEKKNISLLTQLKNKSKDSDFKTKILWLQYILYYCEQNINNQHDILREILSNDNYNYSTLYEKLSETYSDQIQINSDNVQILLHDLKEYPDFKRNFNIYSLANIIDTIFENKKYSQIINLKENFNQIQLEEADKWFEIGFSYDEMGKLKDAENVYEYIHSRNKKSGATLNNLANIYSKKRDIIYLEKAIELYEQAIKIGKSKELYERNLKNTKNTFEHLLREKNEKDYIESSFKKSLLLIKNEDYFSLESLGVFFNNIKKEENFIDGEIPIQNEYFPSLIKTNIGNALKLKDIWISKNYILSTGKYDNYNIPIYKINPYIEEEVATQKHFILERDIPLKWIDGFSRLNISRLDELEYFILKEKVSKFNKKYKDLVNRDFDELVLNYLVGNIKSTVVLSGSFVELILTFYLERKKIRNISYLQNGRTINKNIYDSALNDLISYIEQNNHFGKDFFHLTNLSRVYRNFIHPGLELKEKDKLNKGKSDICFISALEVLKKI